MMNPQLRRSARVNAGVKRHDDRYEWNLMSLGVGEAIQKFRDVAADACKAELHQLLIEKKAFNTSKMERNNQRVEEEGDKVTHVPQRKV